MTKPIGGASISIESVHSRLSHQTPQVNLNLLWCQHQVLPPIYALHNTSGAVSDRPVVVTARGTCVALSANELVLEGFRMRLLHRVLLHRVLSAASLLGVLGIGSSATAAPALESDCAVHNPTAGPLATAYPYGGL
jgi:hypothetical protein